MLVRCLVTFLPTSRPSNSSILLGDARSVRSSLSSVIRLSLGSVTSAVHSANCRVRMSDSGHPG